MKKMRIGLGAVTLFLAAASVMLWRQERGHAGQVEAGRERIAELEHRASGGSPSRSTRPLAAESAGGPAASGSLPDASDTAQPSARHSSVEAARLNDARYQASFAQAKLELQAELQDLREWLEISDEKWERYIDLSAHQSAQREELERSLPGEGQAAELARQVQALSREHEAEDQNLLGPEAYQRFREYRHAFIPLARLRTMNGQLREGERADSKTVRTAAAAMAGVEQQLRQEQRASNAAPSASAGTPARDAVSRERAGEAFIHQARLSREGMLEAARPHLSRAQFRELDAVLTSEYQRVEAHVRGRRRN